MKAKLKENMSELELEAESFLERHGIKFKARFVKYDLYFEDDKEERDIYYLSLSRKGKTTGFKFGQSIHDTRLSIEPSAYDLLAGITKSDPESFEWFCSCYGYSDDSIKALKTYRAVVKEWQKVQRFFTASELEELQEIN